MLNILFGKVRELRLQRPGGWSSCKVWGLIELWFKIPRSEGGPGEPDPAESLESGYQDQFGGPFPRWVGDPPASWYHQWTGLPMVIQEEILLSIPVINFTVN